MAYAAVLSLKQTMDRIYKSENLLSQSEAVFIYEELRNLNSFLTKIEDLPSSKLVDDASASETRVKDAVQTLEDLIDSHLSDRYLILLSDQSVTYDRTSFFVLLSQLVPKVKQEVSSFLTSTLSKNNITHKDHQQQQQQQQQRYCFASSDYNTVNQQQNLLVGLDDQIKTLKELILNPGTRLLVKSVVGMTGIGKTSLVKQVYNDPLVIKEFDTCLFVHIGPHYNRLEEIQLLVLNQLGVFPSRELLHENKDYLNKQLSVALSGKRYLIVLDDVWIDTRVMCTLHNRGFPDTRKGSRVIIITQIQNSSLSPSDVILLQLLNDDGSWKLLHRTAFCNSEDKCSRELEKIGKKIARNCEGLPAAIIQVGENLRGKSFQEWKTLSKKEDPLIITRDDGTPLSKALYFSYMMLPQKLKACFLYMGVFPKKYAIYRSKLIKLWVSEGFVHTYGSLEEMAGVYLDLLIWRGVVLREKLASIDIRKFKNCRLHFTFRSLCVNEAKSEKFFHIIKRYTDCTPENLRSQQRLCIHSNVVLALGQVHEWMESNPNARSLLCYGPKQQYPIVFPLHFRLLKIADVFAIRMYEFPNQLLALVHLRYLAITCDGELPNSISRLLNLEVLIVSQHHNIKLLINDSVYLPKEIWNIHKLKQLYCMGFDLPAPPSDDSKLENLLTISGVSVHTCTVDVLSRIPNLKRVAVQIESAHDSIETFSFFGHFATCYEEFESLKCVVVNPNLSSQIVHSVPNFPMNIKKICLSGCGLPWENMEVIAALPNLRVLKLRWYAFRGSHWKVSEGQFPSLQFLLLEDLDIERWESNNEQFINLDHLIVRHCYKLENIPNQFWYTRLVQVDDCSISFVKKMREWRSIFDTEAKIRSSSIDP